jgi:cytochrome bd-type quinol oxidase subunit 2
LIALPLAFAAPAVVSAQDPSIQGNLKCGTTLKADTSGECDITQGTTGINNIIRDIVNIFSLIVGIVSVIMIIYGGFSYVTSGGDSGKVGNAKNTIIYAIIGLVIVALAQFIVQFVLDKVTNTAGA